MMKSLTLILALLFAVPAGAQVGPQQPGPGPVPGLIPQNNLSDLISASTARTNLGVSATGADPNFLKLIGGTMTGALNINTASGNGINSYANGTFGTQNNAVGGVELGNLNGGASVVRAAGPATNINLHVSGKGTGEVFLENSTGIMFEFTPNGVPTFANHMFASPSSTGIATLLSVTGTDADISMRYAAKGKGGHIFSNTILPSPSTVFSGVQDRTYQTGIHENLNLSGSVTSGTIYANDITVSADTAAIPAGAQGANWLAIIGNAGGGGFAGSRAPLNVSLNMTGGTASTTDADKFFQPAVFNMSGSANMGGSSPHSGLSQGFANGGGSQIFMQSGATNWSGVAGWEDDVGLYGTASSAARVGHIVVSYGLNQGGDFDAGYVLNRVSTAPGFQIAFALAGNNSSWPVATSGAVLQYYPPLGLGAAGGTDIPAISSLGIDLSGVNCTTACFRAPGNFQTDSAGSLIDGSAKLSTSGAVVTLDAPGSQVAAAAISAGGTGYKVGDQIFDRPSGTILTISTVSAGAITGLTITTKGAAIGATPSNPVSFIGGTGSGATVSLTWTAAAVMVVSPSNPATVGITATASALPACSAAIKGARATVTDALGPTFLGALTGGGVVVSPAFCNGSAWVTG